MLGCPNRSARTQIGQTGTRTAGGPPTEDVEGAIVPDVLIMGWIDFEPGDRDLWLDNADELMRATREEVGCVRHVIVADPDSPTAIITQAHYSSVEAFNEHVKSEHFQRFRKQTEHARVRERSVDQFHGTKVN